MQLPTFAVVLVQGYGHFRSLPDQATWRCVFPTCVGVFPAPGSAAPAAHCLPHVRGGVSRDQGRPGVAALSSPRAWGCFSGSASWSDLLVVFPTCVGVFPRTLTPRRRARCLPHVRGGVSGAPSARRHQVVSSPRAWGCFLCPGAGHRRGPVFPTCVGVFPRGAPCSSARVRLPHVRGGVSKVILDIVFGDESSPRAWGCFCRDDRAGCRVEVFPTCVGVFPAVRRIQVARHSLPHVRGGVSLRGRQ